MFSYYGSKYSIVKRYPFPKYDRIVEPFAGAAWYSLTYGTCRDVLLCDINPVIYHIWKWIIEEATLKDVEALPELEVGEDLRNYKQLTDVERDLLGFAVNTGTESPRYVTTKWAAHGRGIDGGNGRGRIELLKHRLRHYLPRIKHWKVLDCSYRAIKSNRRSTWFIDPPYDGPASRAYVEPPIDYRQLACWCRERVGQVIVCEIEGANWLPFRQLTDKKRRTRYVTMTEVVWTNDAEAQ